MYCKLLLKPLLSQAGTADLAMFLIEMSSAAFTRAFFPQLQPLKPAFDSELAPVWPIEENLPVGIFRNRN